VKKPLAAVVLVAGMLLSGCGTPKMSVEESCKFLNGDTFVPSGNQQQQADQIAKHYQEVADKVAQELADPIQKMADVMKQVAGTSLGDKSAEQLDELKKQNNRIGEVCK
jgi:Skp family chaperone for outer membrane proteins